MLSIVRKIFICIFSMIFCHFEYFLVINNVSLLLTLASELFTILEIFIWWGENPKAIAFGIYLCIKKIK